MQNIQKISSYLLFVFNALLVLIPVSIALQWLLMDTALMKHLLLQGFFHGPVSTPEGVVNLGTLHLGLMSCVLGLASDVIGVLPLYVSLFFLKTIFQNYKKGEIFNGINASSYRSLGFLLFGSALLAKPLSESLMVMAVTIINPPGHRFVTIGFGIPNLEALFVGVLVIVISWVMIEATKLIDEQKWTI